MKLKQLSRAKIRQALSNKNFNPQETWAKFLLDVPPGYLDARAIEAIRAGDPTLAIRLLIVAEVLSAT